MAKIDPRTIVVFCKVTKLSPYKMVLNGLINLYICIQHRVNYYELNYLRTVELESP